MPNRQAIAFVGLLLALMTFAAGCTDDDQGGDAGGPDAEERLAAHLEEVIIPETQETLQLLAEECDRNNDPADCVPFGLFVGELSGIRIARYYEAMYWLGVDRPGDEMLGLLIDTHDECKYWGQVLSQLTFLDSEDALAGRCDYFRTIQLPYDPDESPRPR